MGATVTISPGIFILVLCLQNISAQQCLSNVGVRNLAGVQPPAPKTTCGFKQMSQNSGLNYNTPQAPLQQTNFQQQSNIQQTTPQQTSYLQPQLLNSQHTNSQQPVNSMLNSQTLQQQNPNLISNIFSALYNIRQSQNQGTNSAKANPTNYEQSTLLQSQNPANPAFTASTIDKTQYVNQPSPVSNSFTEYSQFQPTFTFHPISRNDLSSQQNQMFVLPVHRSNDQNQDYAIQNQPMISQQSPTVMIPGSQSRVPIVLTLQSPQTSSNAQQTSSANLLSQTNPIIYTVQTQPTSTNSQNQQTISSQPQVSSDAPLDSKSLISYVVSQLQNSSGSKNILGSILPAMLNTKSEKSSSMKTLLPIILSVLNEKRNCCGCPHCGCNNNKNRQDIQEPIINSGYSNQKNYSKQSKTEENLSKTTEVDTSVETTSSDPKANKNKDELPDNILENSEDEEGEDEEEAELSEEESDEE